MPLPSSTKKETPGYEENPTMDYDIHRCPIIGLNTLLEFFDAGGPSLRSRSGRHGAAGCHKPPSAGADQSPPHGEGIVDRRATKDRLAAHLRNEDAARRNDRGGRSDAQNRPSI